MSKNSEMDRRWHERRKHSHRRASISIRTRVRCKERCLLGALSLCLGIVAPAMAAGNYLGV